MKFFNFFLDVSLPKQTKAVPSLHTKRWYGRFQNLGTVEKEGISLNNGDQVGHFWGPLSVVASGSNRFQLRVPAIRR